MIRSFCWQQSNDFSRILVIGVTGNLKPEAMRTHITRPLLAFTMLAIAFALSSCKKEVQVHEADLIGTWDIGQATVDIKVGPISLVTFLKTTLQLSDQEAQEMVDELIADFDYISGGTITFSADYSYQLLNGDFEENGTWELGGNKLYLTVTGEILDNKPLTFEEMDGSTALMVLEDDQDVDIDEDGSKDFTATIIIEVELTKQ